MTPEGKVKDDLKKYLDSLGPDCWYYMPVPMGYGKRGVPDFIICYRGFFLAPETKRAKGGVSQPWQDRAQAEIRLAGGFSDRATTIGLVQTWVHYCNVRCEILAEANNL